MPTAEQILSTARYKIKLSTPYFYSASLTLIPYPVEGLGTFGVTKNWVMAYDPVKVVEWGADKVAGVIVHELCHMLRDHHVRLKRYDDHMRGNLAADLAINPDVVAMGYQMPDGACFPKNFELEEGLTTEEYYIQLEDKIPPQYASGVANGECGSAAGNPGDWEGEVPDDMKRTSREHARTKRSVAGQINKASKQAGNVPAGWRQWAEQEVPDTKVSWRDKIKQAVKHSMHYTSGAVDHYYGRMSRRQWGCGIGVGKPMMPALRAPVPNVGFVMDTSGSMGDDDVLRAAAECVGIIQAVGGRIHFLATDCQADTSSVKQVASVDDLKKLVTGGGGTDFRPAFEALSKLKQRPNLVVFATDGYGPAPEQEPTWCKTIWLIVQQGGVKPAKWGQAIHVYDEVREED